MPDRPDNIVPITSDVRSAAEKFSAEHDRELLTILFTDLIDSTKLQSELGNLEAARLTEIHRKIVRDELSKYDAREINWAGDSCLAVFTKPSDAVVFALRMQAKHRRVREEESRLPLVRVGMHLGEIIVKKGDKKDDLFGLQVSESARVMSVARGNQIFCTRAVFDNARGALKGSTIAGVGDVVWVNYGPYMLKGSEDPIELCEVGSSDVAVLKAPQASDKVAPVSSGASATPEVVDAAKGLRQNRIVVGALVAIVAVLAALLIFPRLSEAPSNSLVAEPAVESVAPPDRPVRRFAIRLDPKYPLRSTLPYDTPLAFSPDGTLLAYTTRNAEGTRQIALYPLETMQARIVEESDRALRPFFSPDGQWLCFDFGLESVKKVPVDGGSAVQLAEIQLNLGSSWGDDGYIYYTPGPGQGIFRVSEDGGTPEQITSLKEGEISHTFPFIFPGGKGLTFSALREFNIQGSTLTLRHMETGEERVLAEHAGAGRAALSGHFVFSQGARLMAMPFDFEAVEPTGPAVDVTEPGMSDGTSVITAIALSNDGTLAYLPVASAETESTNRLIWVDMNGKTTPLSIEPDAYVNVRISPDGRRLGLTIHSYVENSSQVYTCDIERGTLDRVTFDGLENTFNEWSPDGKSVYFLSSISYAVFVKELGSTSVPRQLLGDVSVAGGNIRHVRAVSPDGKYILLYQVLIGDTNIMIRELEGEFPPRPLLASQFPELNPNISPDGKWVAYQSGETGTFEVYVQAFPDLGSKIRISVDGGFAPRWDPGGNRLYFLADDDKLMVSEIESGPDGTLEASVPGVLVRRKHHHGLFWNRQYDIHPDGDRFLFREPVESDGQGREVILVDNWFKVLNEKAPPDPSI